MQAPLISPQCFPHSLGKGEGAGGQGRCVTEAYTGYTLNFSVVSPGGDAAVKEGAPSRYFVRNKADSRNKV
jgi:hypothetical protein